MLSVGLGVGGRKNERLGMVDPQLEGEGWMHSKGQGER